jgi:cell division protein FtsL
MMRVNLVLLAALVACALSLVTSRHEARRLFVELERGEARARQYEMEYGQLQLEQSTWAMPARVEKIAREKGHMQLPPSTRIEIVDLGNGAPNYAPSGRSVAASSASVGAAP